MSLCVPAAAVAVVIAATLVAAAPSPGGAVPAWDYDPRLPHGPPNWAGLDNTVCGARMQSPINIANVIKGTDLKPILPQWVPLSNVVVSNDGKAVTMAVSATQSPKAVFTDPNSNIAHDLVQFHIHSPSEHTFGGSYRDMEIHFVHKSAQGHYAVIGFTFVVSDFGTNDFLASFWNNVKTSVSGGAASTITAAIDPRELKPPTRDYVTYSGSFTTPPCTEGVSWFVMSEPLFVSKKMIDEFRGAMNFTWQPETPYLPVGNMRPPMPLHGRIPRRFEDIGEVAAAAGSGGSSAGGHRRAEAATTAAATAAPEVCPPLKPHPAKWAVLSTLAFLTSLGALGVIGGFMFVAWQRAEEMAREDDAGYDD